MKYARNAAAHVGTHDDYKAHDHGHKHHSHKAMPGQLRKGMKMEAHNSAFDEAAAHAKATRAYHSKETAELAANVDTDADKAESGY